jgi:DNA-binding NarL/FixJ family response regulator
MTTSRPTILFIDDEPMVLSGLRRQLHRLSGTWRLRFHEKPEEALADLKGDPADVLVTDLSMPGMDGLEAAARAREIQPGIVTLMLTGTADMTAAIAALNQGNIFRFLTKPCDSDVLIGGIEDALASLETTRRSGESGDSGYAALDRLATGVAVAGADAVIRFMNKTAARIVSGGDMLVDGAGKLRAARSDEDGLLQQAIARTAVDSGAPPEAVAVECRDGERPYSILAMPLSDDAGLSLIFITDPGFRASPDIALLRSLLGLTEAEARIAQGLAEGLKLDEAAERSGVTVSTARTYLKQIFQKTGAARQSDLVRYILTSPALMVRD